MSDDRDLTGAEQIAVRWLREGDCVSTAGKEGPFHEIRGLQQDEADPTFYDVALDGSENGRMAMEDIVWAQLRRPERVKVWPANTADQTTERDPEEIAAEFMQAVDGGWQAETPGSVHEAYIEWLSSEHGVRLAYERRDRRWLLQALDRQLEDRPDLREKATPEEPFPEGSGSHRVDLDALRSGSA